MGNWDKRSSDKIFIWWLERAIMKKCILLMVLLMCSIAYPSITYIDYTNGTDGGGGTVHDGLAEPADPGGSVYTMITLYIFPNIHTECGIV